MISGLKKGVIRTAPRDGVQLDPLEDPCSRVSQLGHALGAQPSQAACQLDVQVKGLSLRQPRARRALGQMRRL
jgi:hypothetical protein